MVSGSEEEYVDENGKTVRVKKRKKKKSLDDAVSFTFLCININTIYLPLNSELSPKLLHQTTLNSYARYPLLTIIRSHRNTALMI